MEIAIKTASPGDLLASLQNAVEQRKFLGWKLDAEGDVIAWSPPRLESACFAAQCGDGFLLIRLVGIDVASESDEITTAISVQYLGVMVVALLKEFHKRFGVPRREYCRSK